MDSIKTLATPPAGPVFTPAPPNIGQFIANPYSPGVRTDRDALYPLIKEWVDQDVVHHVLEDALKTSPGSETEVMLAVGHYQACANPENPDAVLPAGAFPKSLREAFTTERPRMLPFLMASARAYIVLEEEVLGSSAPILATKKQVWAACFGRNLREALELKTLLRRHHVILIGESGSGKEGLAEAIQRGTPDDLDGTPGDLDGEAALCQVNCAAIGGGPEFVQSALFGHTAGAFTGATGDRPGLLQAADGSSLFLDEVAELGLDSQAMLLRVVEGKMVRPLGSDKEVKADVRFVCATNEDMASLVGSKKFRHDLWARLSGTVIRVPPLRERRDDILQIALHFARGLVDDSSVAMAHVIDTVREWVDSPEVRDHPWTGNVRELRVAVERLILGQEPLGPPYGVPLGIAGGSDEALPDAIRTGMAPMKTVRAWYLERVLAKFGGKRGASRKIASMLGVAETTVARWRKDGSR